MEPERRRSDRIKLTIPLRVHAKDEMGRTFQADAHTILVSRHGALIHLEHPLRLGQTVQLVNQVAKRDAHFRVVGPVSPLTEQGSDWAVESVDDKEGIWGIGFPSPPEGEAGEPKALLECQGCHAVTLSAVSFEEVDVLGTSGVLSRQCPNCGEAVPWTYALRRLAMEAPPGEVEMLSEAHALLTGADRREYKRVALQLPAMVRDYYGGTEVTRTWNVSKGGFCFVSEKTYLVGQGVVAVCPYQEAAEPIEVSARIVWRQDVPALRRRFYGVRYSKSPS
jgi:Tfp pilus assembly protein PilZ